MGLDHYPSLYQINTRVRLYELERTLNRPATLDDIADEDLDWIANNGYDLVWLLGVWQTGSEALKIAQTEAKLLHEYQKTLSDFSMDDVCASCFAVNDYHVHTDFGGDEALARLRARLRQRELKLILDFVPNHVSPDHRWVTEHRDYLMFGNENLLTHQPQNFTRIGSDILAYGRDPYFDGWSDTFQLNYGNPAMQDALLVELKRIATQCDGVRCDMAMLVLPEVFEKTWGIKANPFWLRATSEVKKEIRDFIFMAEVYWDLEWTMMQNGFDYAYDKRLYDRLIHAATRPFHEQLSDSDDVFVRPVREHLNADLEYQKHLVRFLENHDEQRAAKSFSDAVHKAAAVVTFFTMGMRLFHMGQERGYKTRIPVQLRRGPDERINQDLETFYVQLFDCLNDPVFRFGKWSMLQSMQAWDGNHSNDAFIAYAWEGPGNEKRLIVVNYAPHRSQCYVKIPWEHETTRHWQLHNVMSAAAHDQSVYEMRNEGLYVDVDSWGYHVFEVTEKHE